MLIIAVIFGILSVILALALMISVRKNLDLSERFEEMGLQVEESLDIIDDCYQRITKATEIPVTSDEPVVQQLLSDIKYTKHAVLLIANKVITFDNEEDED
jgi:CHASE3 domain sensor protein